MGFFDAIGSAVSSAVGEVEHVAEGVAGTLSKIPDPISMAIEAGGKALGVDPKITGMIELGVSAFTGDVMCGVRGANDIMAERKAEGPDRKGYQQRAADSDKPDPTPKEHGSAPVPSSGTTTNTSSAPQMDDAKALQVIRDHFGALDQTSPALGAPASGSDGRISMAELKNAASNPNLPSDVQAAARYLIDHQGLIDKMVEYSGRPAPTGGFLSSVAALADPGFTVSGLDEMLTNYPKAGPTPPQSGPVYVPPTSTTPPPATSTTTTTTTTTSAGGTTTTTTTTSSGATPPPVTSSPSSSSSAPSASSAGQASQADDDFGIEPGDSIETIISKVMAKLLSEADNDVRNATDALKGKTGDDRSAAQSKLQQAMQARSELISMSSNLLNMEHQASMAVINNIR